MDVTISSCIAVAESPLPRFGNQPAPLAYHRMICAKFSECSGYPAKNLRFVDFHMPFFFA
jgi:hypothetical protein